MARMSSSPDAPHAAADADAGLLRQLASGDRDALDALYRRHEEYARRVATAVSGGDAVVADDLMAEAFAAVFRRAASNDPIANFRAYLGACIRNAHLAHRRDGSRSTPASHQPWLFDAAVDEPELVDGIAAEHAIAALAALPAGWRELLWRVEVEGRSNAELADLMGKSHSAVSSMTHRAREGLRRAFLDRHVPATRASACRWTRQHLSRYVRSELSDRAAGRVRSHVSECATCARVLRDLESLNRRIGASMWPVVLVAAGPTLPVLPNSGASSTPSADASTPSSVSPPAPPAGPLAALAGASPITIVTVVGVAASVVLAAGAVAMKLTGPDANSANHRPVAAAPGRAADAPDALGPAAEEPPAHPLTHAAGPLADAAADRSEKDDEDVEDEKEDEEEDQERPRNPAPTATTTSAPPRTYDASIASVDASDVSGQAQSLTFSVQMNSSGPRTGVVVELAITIEGSDTTDWRYAVDNVSGSGWTCRAPNGEENLDLYVFDPGTTLTCSYEFSDESGPPPLVWDLLIDDADGQVDGATGSAQVSVAGGDDPNGGNDTATF